jgi:hypothetical protein
MNISTRFPDRPEPWHDKRYEESLKYLIGMGLNKSHTVLNFGESRIFKTILEEEIGCMVVDTDHDLRYTHSLPQYDFALMMEVIEHISDMPDPMCVADWTYSGAMNCLRTALNSASQLFLTTPNITSCYSMMRLIRGLHPHMYELHTHEYSPVELCDLVRESGWRDVQLTTRNVWGNHGSSHSDVKLFNQVLKLCKANKYHRNDCIFLEAKR